MGFREDYKTARKTMSAHVKTDGWLRAFGLAILAVKPGQAPMSPAKTAPSDLRDQMVQQLPDKISPEQLRELMRAGVKVAGKRRDSG